MHNKHVCVKSIVNILKLYPSQACYAGIPAPCGDGLVPGAFLTVSSRQILSVSCTMTQKIASPRYSLCDRRAFCSRSCSLPTRLPPPAWVTYHWRSTFHFLAWHLKGGREGRSGSGKTYWYGTECSQTFPPDPISPLTLIPLHLHSFHQTQATNKAFAGSTGSAQRGLSRASSSSASLKHKSGRSADWSLLGCGFLHSFYLPFLLFFLGQADALASSTAGSLKRRSKKHGTSHPVAPPFTVHLRSSILSLPFYHFLLPPWESQSGRLPVFQALWASLTSSQVRVCLQIRDA